jgi:hypothetical protein
MSDYLSATDLTDARTQAMNLNCGCGACTTCEAILNGRHMDVFEFYVCADNLHYRPASALYKVYIISQQQQIIFAGHTIPGYVCVIVVRHDKPAAKRVSK